MKTLNKLFDSDDQYPIDQIRYFIALIATDQKII
jgi:hypothetical protein